MNKKTNTPDLNAASDNEQDYSNIDWNEFLNEPTNASSDITPVPSEPTQQAPAIDANKDEYRQSVPNNANNADHFQREYLDILDQAVAGTQPKQNNDGVLPPQNLNDNGTVDSIVVPPTKNVESNTNDQNGSGEGDNAVTENNDADKDKSGDNVDNTNSPNISDSTKTEDNSSVSSDERSLDQVAFEFIKELDLLRLPENVSFADLTPEKIKEFKQETEVMKREEAIDFLRNNISHDPYMTDLFEYAYKGADYADIPRMRQLMDTEIDYKSLDLSDTEIQKEIVGMFLTEGLDPDNARDARLIASIPNQIEGYESQMQLKDEAELARHHFVQKAQEQQRAETLRVQQKLEEAENQRRYQEDLDKQWNRDFRQVIADSPWSQERKNAVVKEARDIITLDNGTQMPAWQYKQQLIMNDPKLFHVFLDFTSKLDLNKNEFVNYGTNTQNQETVAQILERIAGKQTGNNGDGTGGTTTLTDPNKTVAAPTIDAGNDNWFF